MTGSDLCRLMREHKVTIRQLAQRMGNTQKQIRLRRASRYSLPLLVWLDYAEAVRGYLTEEERMAFAQS